MYEHFSIHLFHRSRTGTEQHPTSATGPSVNSYATHVPHQRTSVMRVIEHSVVVTTMFGSVLEDSHLKNISHGTCSLYMPESSPEMHPESLIQITLTNQNPFIPPGLAHFLVRTQFKGIGVIHGFVVSVAAGTTVSIECKMLLLLLSALAPVMGDPGCSCGYGGVCRSYATGSFPGWSAIPCSCKEISDGIYEPATTNCSTLVNHCTPHMCLNGGTCYEAFANYVCACPDGWEGMNCSVKSSKATQRARFVHIWYLITEQSWARDVVIGVSDIAPTTIISFTTPISGFTVTQSDLEIILYEKVIQTCRDKSHDSPGCARLETLSTETRFWFRFHFFIPLTTQVLDTVVDLELGPLGQTWDTRIVLKDGNVVQHDAFYRMYNEFEVEFRICPFTVDFIGCSQRHYRAPIYPMGVPVTLAVALNYSTQEAEDDCFAKYRQFDWSIASVSRRENKRVFTGSVPKVVFVPLNFSNLVPGLAQISVNISLMDIQGVPDFSVPARCHIQLIRRELSVYAEGAVQKYQCGDPVRLKAKTKYNDYSASDLSYTWYCEICLESHDDELILIGDRLECNKEYNIRLEVTHPWSLTVASHMVKFSTSSDPQLTNIALSCLPTCSHANPDVALTLTAIEVPERSGAFTWDSLTVDIGACRDPRVPNQYLIIKEKTLGPNKTHLFSVNTSYGSTDFNVVTVCPSTGIFCNATPVNGTLLTYRTISCAGGDPKRYHKYAINEGKFNDLLTLSSAPFIDRLRFTWDESHIVVSDYLGCTEIVPLNLSVFPLSLKQLKGLKGEISDRVNKLQSFLHENNYMMIVREVDWISKLESDAPGLITVEMRHSLMYYLGRVDDCPWFECVAKIGNSLRRLTSSTLNYSRIGDFILSAAMALLTISHNLRPVMEATPELGAHHLRPILQGALNAFSALVRLQDPVLYSGASADIKQMHFRKVQEANSWAREAMKTISHIITENIPHPTTPFDLKSRVHGDKMVVISNFPMYVNVITTEISPSSSHFEFSAQSIAKLKESPVSVTEIIYNLGNFWWAESGESSRASSHLIEIHVRRFHPKTKWRTSESDSGPYQIRGKAIVDKVAFMTGVAKATNSNKTIDLDQTVNTYLILLPRGHGTLFFVFPTNLIGRIRHYFNLSSRPDYKVMLSQPFLQQTVLQFNYYSKESETDAYFGLISSSTLVYSFNLTLIRCVTRSEDIWKSENCWYRNYNQTETCKCKHMSLVDIEVLIPRNMLSPAEDIYLFTEIADNWYVALFMLCVILLLISLLIYGGLRDKRDEFKKTIIVLEDNYPWDSHPYLIGIYTGERCLSGTSSHVAIRLVGTKSLSKVHILKSPDRSSQQHAMDDWYLLFTNKHLGHITEIHLWHDSTGRFQDWYCDKAIVFDLRTLEKYVFPVKIWLSPLYFESKGEGMVTVEKRHEEESWKSHVFPNILTMTRNGHHWASIFIRHPRSLYTHCDRVVIASVAVTVTILVSMMFFKRESGPVDSPIMTFHLTDFYHSLYSAIIALAATAPTIILFDKGKEKALSQYLDAPKAAPTVKHMVTSLFAPSINYLPIMTSDQYFSQKRRMNNWYLTAWTVSLLIIAVSSFFIIFYGLKFGKRLSLIWLVTFALSLLCEILLLDPAKLILIALTAALIFRKSTLESVKIIVQHDENYPNDDVEPRLAYALSRRVLPMYKPLTMDVIRVRAIERRWNWIIWVTLVLLVLLATITLILIINCDIKENHNKVKQLQFHFTESKIGGEYDLLKVRNRTGYFNYIRRVILPSLHRSTWYNGVHLKNESNEHAMERGFAADYSTKLMGVPIFRLKRIAPSWKISNPMFNSSFTGSFGKLTILNEDTIPYSRNWGNLTEETYEIWDWESSKETKEGWLLGRSFYFYSGSGYIEKLHWSKDQSYRKLINLQLDNWINNGSRVIFFSFNMYNAYVDKVATITVITECLPAGVYTSRTLIDSASVAFFESRDDRGIGWVVIGVFIILILLLARALFLASNNGIMVYLSTWSGINDVLLLWIGFATVTAFGYRFFYFTLAADHLENAARDAYTSLFNPFFYHSLSLVLTGLLAVAVACSAATLIQQFLRFRAIGRAVILARTSVTILSMIGLIYTYLFTFEFYLLGTLYIPSLYLVFKLQETTSWDDYLGPSDHFRYFLLIYPLFAALLLCHLAILIAYYAIAFEELFPVKRSLMVLPGRPQSVIRLRRKPRHELYQGQSYVRISHKKP